ncbi:hypothetical protein MKX03_023169 [Papaver bracteatum]|nr:hypothetical protein MKX03_023169 [Papaver bracteatum]
MASFIFSYLFILFSTQGIYSLCYTEQDTDHVLPFLVILQRMITSVPIVRTSWKVNFVSLFTSTMCCLIISDIEFSQDLTSHCVSYVDG